MTQSILELDTERYLKEAEERLLCLSDAYYYKKKFLLGKGVDRDELNFVTQTHRALSSDNCEMIQYIADKIAGKLESSGQIVVDYDFELLMAQHTRTFNCSEQDTLNSCDLNWETAQW